MISIYNINGTKSVLNIPKLIIVLGDGVYQTTRKNTLILGIIVGGCVPPLLAISSRVKKRLIVRGGVYSSTYSTPVLGPRSLDARVNLKVLGRSLGIGTNLYVGQKMEILAGTERRW